MLRLVRKGRSVEHVAQVFGVKPGTVHKAIRTHLSEAEQAAARALRQERRES